MLFQVFQISPHPYLLHGCKFHLLATPILESMLENPVLLPLPVITFGLDFFFMVEDQAGPVQFVVFERSYLKVLFWHD